MCPHFFFLQLVARGGRRACTPVISISSRGWGRISITYVALSADHLVAVELGCKGLERRLNDTTTETENEMKSRFLETSIVSHQILEIILPVPSNCVFQDQN